MSLKTPSRALALASLALAALPFTSSFAAQPGQAELKAIDSVIGYYELESARGFCPPRLEIVRNSLETISILGFLHGENQSRKYGVISVGGFTTRNTAHREVCVDGETDAATDVAIPADDHFWSYESYLSAGGYLTGYTSEYVEKTFLNIDTWTGETHQVSVKRLSPDLLHFYTMSSLDGVVSRKSCKYRDVR